MCVRACVSRERERERQRERSEERERSRAREERGERDSAPATHEVKRGLGPSFARVKRLAALAVSLPRLTLTQFVV